MRGHCPDATQGPTLASTPVLVAMAGVVARRDHFGCIRMPASIRIDSALM